MGVPSQNSATPLLYVAVFVLVVVFYATPSLGRRWFESAVNEKAETKKRKNTSACNCVGIYCCLLLRSLPRMSFFFLFRSPHHLYINLQNKMDEELLPLTGLYIYIYIYMY